MIFVNFYEQFLSIIENDWLVKSKRENSIAPLFMILRAKMSLFLIVLVI